MMVLGEALRRLRTCFNHEIWVIYAAVQLLDFANHKAHATAQPWPQAKVLGQVKQP